MSCAILWTTFRRSGQQIETMAQRAEDLLPRTLELIEQTSDPHLRRFFKRGVPVSQQPKLGEVCHLALWEEVFTSNSTDHLFLKSMSAGFPLRGPTELSNTWEPIVPELWPHFNPEELADRAWGIRQRVKSKVSRNSETQLWAKHGKELWNKTILDVQLGFCLGPYTSEERSALFCRLMHGLRCHVSLFCKAARRDQWMTGVQRTRTEWVLGNHRAAHFTHDGHHHFHG